MKPWVVCWVIAVGCGGGDPDPEKLDRPDLTAASGTRLHLQVYDVGGARAIGRAQRDAQLDAACLIRTWSDGRSYCTPDAEPVVFTDDRCTQPAAIDQTDPCIAGRYVLDEPDLCRGPERLYELGAPISAAQYYNRGLDGSCNGPYPAALRALGRELLTSDLVEVTAMTAPARGRLARTFLVSADGARIPSGAHDTELDLACTPQADRDGSGAHCVPTGATPSSLFGDATCSAPIAGVLESCAPPAYVLRPDLPCSIDGDRFYTLGAQITPTALSLDFGSGCMATQASPDLAYYAVGAELQVAELTRGPGQVAGQAVQQIAMSDGKTELLDAALYDTAHDVECVVQEFADGTLRCLGFQPSIRGYFRDPDCKDPIDLASQFKGAAGCAAPPAPRFAHRFVEPPAGTCGISVALYDLGAAYTQPVYQNFSGCTRAPDTSAYYEIGAARSIDELPTARRVD
jgi:hypothetical protein